jgi:hypothetical protein
MASPDPWVRAEPTEGCGSWSGISGPNDCEEWNTDEDWILINAFWQDIAHYWRDIAFWQDNTTNWVTT